MLGDNVMALIKCPECQREISDRAATCIHCGCPLGAASQTKIKIQNCDWTTFMQPVSVGIYNNNRLLWSGQTGQVAILNIDTPIEIVIKIEGVVLDTRVVVKPNYRYSLERVRKTCLRKNMSFILNEIDVIDSERMI